LKIAGKEKSFQIRFLLSRLFTVVFFTTFLPFSAGCKNSNKSQIQKSENSKIVTLQENAEVVAKRFFELETKEDFIHQYNLLSIASKKDLGQKNHVVTAEQYCDYRSNLEAMWSEFVITEKLPEGDKGVVFSGHAKVEENGESSIVNFKCILVKEGTEWKVDRFKY
jgi:hypothetical protein